jgi:hypothetical protein
MKPAIDVPEDIAHLLEKRDKPDRRAPKPAGEKAAKPPAERRKRNRRKP